MYHCLKSVINCGFNAAGYSGVMSTTVLCYQLAYIMNGRMDGGTSPHTENYWYMYDEEQQVHEVALATED